MGQEKAITLKISRFVVQMKVLSGASATATRLEAHQINVRVTSHAGDGGGRPSICATVFIAMPLILPT